MAQQKAGQMTRKYEIRCVSIPGRTGADAIGWDLFKDGARIAKFGGSVTQADVNFLQSAIDAASANVGQPDKKPEDHC